MTDTKFGRNPRQSRSGLSAPAQKPALAAAREFGIDWRRQIARISPNIVSSPAFWKELFAPEPEAGPVLPVRMKLLLKGGRPLLLLPARPRLATACLELYPAQSLRGRAARAALRWLWRAGLPLGAKTITVQIPQAGAFARFLAETAGVPSGRPPPLGVLAGNPATAGQRFLVLLFDSRQHPVAVVKVGATGRAKELVAKEEQFLASAAGQVKGVPRLRGGFHSERLSALALDYFRGDSPKPCEQPQLASLLGSWIHSRQTRALAELPDWRRLEAACAGEARSTPMLAPLRARTVQAVVGHGDFAPWNIKVTASGQWMVLDWERGELAGIPGWDWFHYLLQPAILVERLAGEDLVKRVEAVLASELFRGYAAQAAIAGSERPLLLAYLLHCVKVLKPSEGLAQTGALLEALRARWLKD